jgi:hypothetical protein
MTSRRSRLYGEGLVAARLSVGTPPRAWYHSGMRTLSSAIVVALLLLATTAHAEKWKEMSNDKFGIRMLVPPKMKMIGKDAGDWGGLFGVLGPVKIYGLARIGAFPDEAKMKIFAASHVAIPWDKWQLIKEAKNKRGWTWAKTYRAEVAGRVVFAILGHGPKGAYLIYLGTTPANLKLFKLAYLKWYLNVRVF